AHLPFWGASYVLIIAPSQLLFTLLYLWRRSVVPGVIAHLLCDVPAYSGQIVSLVIGAMLSIAPAVVVPASFYETRALDEMTVSRREAIRLLSIAIRKDSEDSNAWWWRGVAHEQEKQYDRAVADLTEATRLDPKNQQLWEWRGYTYYAAGRFDAAV